MRKRDPVTHARRSERPRVLVTDGENIGVLAMVRGLKRRGYEPWVVSAHSSAAAFRSRATAGRAIVPSPRASARRFADEVGRIARAIRPAAIMPGGETGMVALSRYRGGIPSDARLAVCHSDTVARATDKAALARLAESAGLRVPPTFAISAHEAERGLPVELPAVVKPPRSQIVEGDGFRGFGVTMARTRAEVARALRALPGERGLIQHYHTGTLCGVGGVFWDGEMVTAVHQRAVRTWPMGCGEMSFAVARPRDAELERSISRMLLNLGWAGLFQVQFIDTDDGPLPIDLNPRVYGSLALALGVGPNLPGVWADVVTGRAVENRVAYDVGVRFRNEVLDSRALLAACLSGRHSGKHGDARTERGGHSRTVNAYYERSDPRPLLALPWIVGTRLRARAIHHH